MVLSHDLQVMEDKLGEYFAGKAEVVAAYLFGSYARKKNRLMSDVDIAVILTNTGKDLANQKRLQYMVELSRILRKDIHPVIMNTASEELLRKIFSKGKCIQVNDSRALSRYRTYAIAQIAEFGHYRETLQKGFIQKLKEEGQNGR